MTKFTHNKKQIDLSSLEFKLLGELSLYYPLQNDKDYIKELESNYEQYLSFMRYNKDVMLSRNYHKIVGDVVLKHYTRKENDTL